ncbi:unnamed protein product, partial [marine sediment metagenome]
MNKKNKEVVYKGHKESINDVIELIKNKDNKFLIIVIPNADELVTVVNDIEEPSEILNPLFRYFTTAGLTVPDLIGNVLNATTIAVAREI